MPLPVWTIGIAGLLLAPLTANPTLTACALLALPLLFVLLWRPPETPILLFACGIQWLQSSAKVFKADVLGVEVSTLFFGRDVIEEAIFYSLAGVLTLALGMRLGAGRFWQNSVQNELASMPVYRLHSIWYAYLGAAAAGFVIGKIAWQIPGLTQVLLQFANLRFFFLFVFVFAVLRQRRGYPLLLGALAVEVVVGFLGYFAGFKQVFFVFIVAFVTARPRLTVRDYGLIIAVASLLMVFSMFWLSMRVEYRQFLSQGERAQVVKVQVQDRLNWVSGAARGFGANEVGAAVETLVDRVSYVEFFAYVLERVPRATPHEDGRLWFSAVRHVLMPRLFFPGKPVLQSDSELTMKYTGLFLASDSQGTSISIGYMGESYIDFGFPLMLAPILLIGLMWGAIHRYFMGLRPYSVLNQAAATYVLFGAILLEMHNVKLLGGVLTSFITMALFMKFLAPLLVRYFAKGRKRR